MHSKLFRFFIRFLNKVFFSPLHFNNFDYFSSCNATKQEKHLGGEYFRKALYSSPFLLLVTFSPTHSHQRQFIWELAKFDMDSNPSYETATLHKNSTFLIEIWFNCLTSLLFTRLNYVAWVWSIHVILTWLMWVILMWLTITLSLRSWTHCEHRVWFLFRALELHDQILLFGRKKLCSCNLVQSCGTDVHLFFQ